MAPDANHNYHFLFSKKGMVQMRADQEFKAGTLRQMEAHAQTSGS